MSTITKLENSRVKIELEATREEFEAALKKAYEKDKKRFMVPGFRKGKVPYQLVVKYYGEGVLYEKAIDEIANSAYGDALKEHDLKVVSRPELDVEEIGENGMKYSLVVTVMPEVKVTDYKGVEVPYSEREVSDKTVDDEIERMRKRNSSLENVEGRAVQDGDTAVIDYEGFKDGVAFDGGKGENYSLKIGSKTFIPGFEEQIIGHNIGDEFAIEVTFPEDYHAEELKGAPVTFNVKLHNIKEEKVPELDDEFVKDVSEFDTLEELKADIRKNQKEAAEKDARNQFLNDVVEAVSEKAEVEVPDVMVENEANSMMEEQSARMSQQGIQLEVYLKYIGQTAEEFRDGLKPMAAKRVRANLVIDAVAKAENIEASDEEYNKEIEDMASAYKMSVDDIKGALGDKNPMVTETIVRRKTVEFLADNAVKTEPKEEEKKEEESES
ncbi:MAG: trigger factor [Clostridiales bacterium]|nr:trigger factor [Clostridiales bacterium]